MGYPLRHISLRVPWHDTAWDGHVCANPHLNSSCLKLRRIAQSRNDAAEEKVKGRLLSDLTEDQLPCCVGERVSFLADFDLIRTVNHPYNHGPETPHGHFDDTPLRQPEYSAPAIPFRWVLRDNMPALAEEHALDVQEEREPDLGDFGKEWVQNKENQKALLDCFKDHLKDETSLCFFYAKQVPFVEDSAGARVLIGVGRVLHTTPAQEYRYKKKDLTGKLRSMMWEMMIQHSIRPGFKDGFIFPYHAAIDKAATDPTFDPAEIAALVPQDRFGEFSYASELVTHDGAIGALLSSADALRKAKDHLPGPWGQCLRWIDARLAELWKARGPCPGLGAALSAFGLGLGTFVAREVAAKVGDNEDPWPLVEAIFSNPAQSLPQHLAEGVGETLCKKWKRLPDERKALLKLVSRFEIEPQQAALAYVQEERAKAGIDCTDGEILANPYLLFESTRLSADPISVWTVDRGVFPDEIIRKKHPLPKPSALDAGTDARRVRALAVNVLEDTAASGSTLVPQSQLVLQIRGASLQPACDVDGDLLNVAKDIFPGTITETALADGAPALQLQRLVETADVIRDAIDKRLKGKRLAVNANWRALLDEHLRQKGTKEIDEFEESARLEKTAALKELAEARVSVLIGPAGTGKTTLLSVLCSHPMISAGGILLLAPTGKARVRMEQSAELLSGQTIAQFLKPHRYDGSTGRYRLSDKPAEPGARTVIVDECSMLTEEMLAALIQALKSVQRLILIGDPRQLPPIGAGRPFLDIVKHVTPEGVTAKFPRVGPGYTELTVRRRQGGADREDLQLAEWFSGSPIAPGEDDVFDKVVREGASKHVRFVEWTGPDDLNSKLIGVLTEELGLSGPSDIAGFDATLGGTRWKELSFFNPWNGNEGTRGAAQIAEGWQILSPMRTAPHGVPALNRLIHRQFRAHQVDASRKQRNRKYTKPMGTEEIVYGDKIINLINTDPAYYLYRHRRVYPAKDNAYIANGEIGMVIGYFWRNGARDFRWKLEAEFSSQPGFKYDFLGRDFKEEGNPALELAYALTVHKAQGSEFGKVFLILPNPCRLLSRELLYTALTRQTERVVILHQGPRSELRRYSSDDRSETARRLTNLFEVPQPIEIEGRFYEEKLIHRTSRREMVRSKSEVIIADRLAANGIDYTYEQPLTIDNITKYPDFTIEDMESGENYYWEHCGMLHVPQYRKRWEEKLAWYRANNILPSDEGGGTRGVLIITRDGENGSIDAANIDRLITQLLKA
jgi:ATP-dependent exoDNAse (exonuclease V) alpha subunit